MNACFLLFCLNLFFTNTHPAMLEVGGIAAGDAHEELSEATKALFRSCKSGNYEEFVASLVAGADVNAVNKKGKPVWHVAATHKGRMRMLKKLFTFGAHLKNIPAEESGYTRGLKTQGLGLLQLLEECGAQPSKDPKIRQKDLKAIIKSGSFQSLTFAFERGIFIKDDIAGVIGYAELLSRTRENSSVVKFLEAFKKMKEGTYQVVPRVSRSARKSAMCPVVQRSRKREASVDDPGTPRPGKKMDTKLSA